MTGDIMRNCKLLIVLLGFMLVFTGCGKAAGPASPDQGNGGQKLQPAGAEPKTTVSLKECDWTIRVSETQKGSYSVMGKKITANLTLDLAAWKDGGADVLGQYTGEGYIKVDMDVSGLTGGEYSYTGGGMFDRKCEELQFSVVPYDSEEYTQNFPEMPGKVFVAPLGDFNAMSFLKSGWVTAAKDDTQVFYEGSQVLDSQRSYGDGQEDALGINLLVEGGSVIVEIPTYEFTWNIGPFRGTITGDPTRSGKHEKLNIPEIESARSGDGSSGDDIDTVTGGNDISSDNPDETPGGFITDETGKTGFDLNNDGKVDWYFDEEGNQYKDSNFDGKFEWVFYNDGRTGLDTNGDGEPDEIFEGEFSEGALD